MKRTITLAAFTLMILLLVMIVTVSLLAASRTGENIIRREAETRIGNALGAPVRIGSLETNLLSRLVVGDVGVFPDSSAAEPSITLARGLVRYRLWDLVRARLTLSEVRLDSLRADVVRDSTGIVSLPMPARGGDEGTGDDGAGFPLDIRLGRLTVHDGEVRLSDRVIRLDGDVRDFDAAIGRDGGGYALELDAGPGRVDFRGNPLAIDRIALRGFWRDGVLNLSDIELAVTGLAITAETAFDTGESPPALDGHITVTGDPAPAAAMMTAYIPGGMRPLGGDIRLDARFTDLLDSTRTVTAAIDIDSLRARDAVLGNAIFRGGYRDGVLSVDELRGALFGGGFEGTGTITPGGGYRHDVSLTLSGIELGEALRAATGSEQPYAGRISAIVTSQGALDVAQLRANLTLGIEQLSRDNQSIEGFDVTLSCDHGDLDADLRQGGTVLRAKAAIHDRALSGEFDATIDRLRPIVLLFGLTGLDAAGTVRGSLSGTIDRPRFDVSVDARDGIFRGLPVVSLSGRLSYRDGEFTVGESAFRGEAASVDSLVSAWGLPGAIHGGIRYAGSFTGWADNPHVELTAVLTAPAWNDIVFDRGAVDLGIDGMTLTVERATLVRNGQPVSASAVYAIDRSRIAGRLVLDDSPPSPPSLAPGDAVVDARTFADGAFARNRIVDVDFGFGEGAFAVRASGGNIGLSELYRMYSGSDSLAAGGSLSFRAAFEGGMDRPSGALRLRADDPHYGTMSAGTLDLTAHADPSGIVLDSLAVQVQDFRTVARGRAAFVRDSGGGVTIGLDSGVQGSLRGRAPQLALLNSFLPGGFTVEGVSEYDITWRGTVGAPQVNGSLRVDGGRVFRGGDTPFADSLAVQLAFRDSVLHIETFQGMLQETPFSLAGNVSIAGARRYGAELALSIAGREAVAGGGTIAGDTLDLHFRSEAFDLALVRPFVPRIGDLAGRVQSDVVIGGAVSNPTINGRVLADSLELRPPLIDERITAGTVDLRFDGSTATIDSLTAGIGGGTVTARGSVNYQNGAITGIDIAAAIRGVRIDRENVFSLAINTADLRYRRENGGYLLSGDVVLDESRLEYNVPVQLAISYIRGERGRPSEPPAMLRQTRMEIRLRGGDRLWVDNNLANVRMHPELEFVGTLAVPNVTGRLSIEEGYILYLDRRFEVTQGVVDFVSRERLQPIIEFHALANIEGSQTFGGDAYAVTFEITGPLDEARVRLTSEPQLSNADIVSLLTFGATGEQLSGRGEDNATVRTILADRIAKLGSEQLSMYVSRELGDLLGIDKVSIQGDLFAFGGSWGPQLVASQQFNERLEVTYTTNVGQLNQQGIRLDYKLSRFFSVEGHTNQTGKSGVDLKYSLKFK